MTYESSPASKRPKPNGQRIPVSSYLETETYDALVDAANRNGRTVAGEIRLAVRDHLERLAAAA
jgi:hypothetical protein